MRGARNGAAFAAAIAATAACVTMPADAQHYQYQSRPSITYHPSQPSRTYPSSQPTIRHQSSPPTQTYQSSPPTQTYPSSQPTQTYQSSQPTQIYRSSQPPQPSQSTSSSSTSPSAAPQPPQTRSTAQPAQPPAVQSQPNQPAQTGQSLAQNSARCLNSDKSVQPDASIAGCNAVIQETTKNLAAAFFYRGTANMAKRDFDRAIADYSQAVAIDPSEADYLNGRAGAYEAKNDLTRAMADYDKAIQLNPQSAYAFNNRGASFQRKGDYARASADYGEVTRLQPNNADAWAARCWVRAAGGREMQQALNDCNQALKIKADAPDVLDTRGFVHLRLGKVDDAIKDYDAALKLDPKLAGALYGRGIAKAKKGDRNGGSSDITTAKAIRSDIAEEFARYGLR
jgi:tetratricopeptide (TPR) repeat protein